ncbi:MAG: biotin--[acetyl-CoA-carboxylase] ligase [Treponema sp.]|jgi:BirA family biotin operon repressor/biotin-[acetyl-CoA-carboxylase] ligase|nr:biotin--[acetyl-CoA-carboxylase] ligase [Treponema sp.]
MKEKTKAVPSAQGLSSKARLLARLREKQGEFIGGSVLAKDMGISRVAVWKTVQSLIEAGYSIETGDAGYLLDPKKEKDFLYPWEFGEKESLFCHYINTSSTMDRARELALRGAVNGTVITAEKQSAGRGRSGRTWISRQGGLFFTILERPCLAIADYTLLSLIIQISIARTVASICGKKTYLRWPNDIYINKKKIAGVTTEISGEGDLITWLSCGIGVNINNPAPSAKAASCAEITGHEHSRREILEKILVEIEKVKNTFNIRAAYSQGNRSLASEWNSMADCIGAKAVVFEPIPGKKDEESEKKPVKILARGVFQGIDPAGRGILRTEGKKGILYFNQGAVSMAFLNADNRLIT